MTSNTAAPTLQGSLVALVTPMHPDGSLDFDSYKKLIDWHIDQGTNGIVVVGTSGESPSVDMDEHAEIIQVAVEHAAGRIPVVAGIGGNSTSEAMILSKHALEVGADAGLSVVPYYNKPSQEGLYQHFKAVAEAVELPSLLYNVPGRTVADLAHETVMRLAALPNIIGIKDATADIERVSLMVRDAPEGFQILSGDDGSAAALILMGGIGNISVTANVAPKLMSELCAAALVGDVKKTREINVKLARINQALFIESNPIPVKWALAEMGRIQLAYRLPMVALAPQYHNTVRAALQELDLI